MAMTNEERLQYAVLDYLKRKFEDGRAINYTSLLVAFSYQPEQLAHDCLGTWGVKKPELFQVKQVLQALSKDGLVSPQGMEGSGEFLGPLLPDASFVDKANMALDEGRQQLRRAADEQRQAETIATMGTTVHPETALLKGNAASAFALPGSSMAVPSEPEISGRDATMEELKRSMLGYAVLDYIVHSKTAKNPTFVDVPRQFSARPNSQVGMDEVVQFQKKWNVEPPDHQDVVKDTLNSLMQLGLVSQNPHGVLTHSADAEDYLNSDAVRAERDTYQAALSMGKPLGTFDMGSPCITGSFADVQANAAAKKVAK